MYKPLIMTNPMLATDPKRRWEALNLTPEQTRELTNLIQETTVDIERLKHAIRLAHEKAIPVNSAVADNFASILYDELNLR